MIWLYGCLVLSEHPLCIYCELYDDPTEIVCNHSWSKSGSMVEQRVVLVGGGGGVSSGGFEWRKCLNPFCQGAFYSSHCSVANRQVSLHKKKLPREQINQACHC